MRSCTSSAPPLSLICGLPPLRILVVNGPLNALEAAIFPDILASKVREEEGGSKEEES